VTADSGAGADNQNETVSSDAQSAAGETPDRKVAKTMLDGQIPTFSEQSTAGSEVSEESVAKKEKRVAKTMLEMVRPTAEEIIAASEAAEQEQISERKVAKTMMEISLPLQSDTLKQVKKVSKTMLDVDSLDAIGMAKALKAEQKRVPVKVKKTLTGDLPRLSKALDALNAASAAEDKTVVSAQGDDKTVVSQQNDRTVVSAQNDMTVVSPQNDTQPTAEDAARRTRKRTRGTERFVAKTMLDHSILSEQVVKSHEKEKMKAAYIAQEKSDAPVKEFHEVDSKKLAAPCAWTWNETGGRAGRVKACDTCQTKVYDLSGMEMPEAEALIFKHESKKKFELFKRADGKFMTTDCPVQAQRKRSFMLLAAAGVLVLVCILALATMMPSKPTAPPAVPASGGQLDSSSNGAVNSGKNASESNNVTSDSTGNSNSAANDAPVGVKSAAPSSDGKPTMTNTDGKIHYEAGNPNLQQAPNPGLFPSVTRSAEPTRSGDTETQLPSTK
jgi:hypothetical protein